MTRPTVTADPGVQFGQPCVTGTRVPVSVLAGEVWAGASLDEAAASYDVGRLDVAWCCAFTVSDGVLLPEMRRRVNRERTARWFGWSQHVIGVLGGHFDGPVGDPDDWEVGG